MSVANVDLLVWTEISEQLSETQDLVQNLRDSQRMNPTDSGDFTSNFTMTSTFIDLSDLSQSGPVSSLEWKTFMSLGTFHRESSSSFGQSLDLITNLLLFLQIFLFFWSYSKV